MKADPGDSVALGLAKNPRVLSNSAAEWGIFGLVDYRDEGDETAAAPPCYEFSNSSPEPARKTFHTTFLRELELLP